MKGFIFCFLLGLTLFYSLIGLSQDRREPKQLKTKGEYIHVATQSIFPVQFDNLTRTEVYSFNKANTNIGVVYEHQMADRYTVVSIYIYPAGDEGSEGRLRNEYTSSRNEIFKPGSKVYQSPVKYVDNYICNGIKAVCLDESSKQHLLTVYECGTWFLKMRITSDELDADQVAKLCDHLVNTYKPSRLTSLKPLLTKPNIYVAEASFADELLLGSISGSAFKKLQWANENISELEKSSGFPDQYLEMHIQAMEELLEFRKKHPDMHVGQVSKRYLEQIELIVNSGFIAEFIMSKHHEVLIVPGDLKLDYDGFEEWQRSNPITIDFNRLYYVISYGKK